MFSLRLTMCCLKVTVSGKAIPNDLLMRMTAPDLREDPAVNALVISSRLLCESTLRPELVSDASQKEDPGFELDCLS